MLVAARNNEKNLALICLGVVFLLSVRWVQAQDTFEPWSANDQCPVITARRGASSQAPAESKPEEMGRACAYTWLKIYQNYFSVVLTSHCPMYPSCSHYSIQAINRYGAAKGIMMTADRLIHEGTAAKEAPIVQIGGRSLCFDPVDANGGE